MASTPLGKVNRLLEGSYSGLNQGGQIFRIADSPTSTIVSLTSALVCPTSAIGLYFSFAHLIVNSAPVRVLPPPRPLSNSQIYQSQSGGNCLGLAHAVQSCKRASASFSVSKLRIFCLSDSDRQAIKYANEFWFGINFLHLYWSAAFPGYADISSIRPSIRITVI